MKFRNTIFALPLRWEYQRRLRDTRWERATLKEARGMRMIRYWRTAVDDYIFCLRLNVPWASPDDWEKRMQRMWGDSYLPPEQREPGPFMQPKKASPESDKRGHYG